MGQQGRGSVGAKVRRNNIKYSRISFYSRKSTYRIKSGLSKATQQAIKVMRQLIALMIINASQALQESHQKTVKSQSNDIQKFLVKVGKSNILTITEGGFKRSIINYKVPLYQDLYDLIKYYQAYISCLETATTTTSFSTISIIEVWGKQMMMPKQYCSEIIIRALMEFIEEKNVKDITFKIISNDEYMIRFLRYELLKYIDDSFDEEFAKSRKKIFQRFINPSRQDVLEELREQEALRNDFSFSQIKLINKLEENV